MSTVETFRVVWPNGVRVHLVTVQRVRGDVFRVESAEHGTRNERAGSARVAVERYAAWYIGIGEVRGPGEQTTAEQLAVSHARVDAAEARVDAAEALAAEAMTTGLAECERLRKVLARWQEALLCHAPECSKCYRPATWEKLVEENEDEEGGEKITVDIRCDRHKSAEGEWVERACVEELRTLGRFAEARAEHLKATGMRVIEEVLQRHAQAKGGAP